LNPYKEVASSYGPNVISIYRGKELANLNPHIYATAEEAITKMLWYTLKLIFNLLVFQTLFVLKINFTYFSRYS